MTHGEYHAYYMTCGHDGEGCPNIGCAKSFARRFVRGGYKVEYSSFFFLQFFDYFQKKLKICKHVVPGVLLGDLSGEGTKLSVYHTHTRTCAHARTHTCTLYYIQDSGPSGLPAQGERNWCLLVLIQ